MVEVVTGREWETVEVEEEAVKVEEGEEEMVEEAVGEGVMVEEAVGEEEIVEGETEEMNTNREVCHNVAYIQSPRLVRVRKQGGVRC